MSNMDFGYKDENVSEQKNKVNRSIQRGSDSIVGREYGIEVGVNREDSITNANGGAYIEGNVNVTGDFIGRDKIGILIQNNSQVFVGDYEVFQDAYIRADSVFERLDLEHFTGREWLFEEVDRFLKENDRGYFVLEAASGLGKSTFMAKLIKNRNYIHHFCELARGINNIEVTIRNFVAQLALAYEVIPEGVLSGSAGRTQYFSNILNKASGMRRDGEKIVIVIDALDEAGTPSNQNVLGLPNDLPEGVYIIASRRPGILKVPIKETPTVRRVIRLTAESESNRNDITHHLTKVATTNPKIAGLLASNGVSVEKFVETLSERSKGVWIYLHYVISDLESGEQAVGDLNSLPSGLGLYYDRLLMRWLEEFGEQMWYEKYLPLLTMLAASQEQLTIQQLRSWSGSEISTILLRVLLEQKWSPFLTVDKSGKDIRYRLQHASLQEYLEGQVNTNDFFDDEQSRLEIYAEETKNSHANIADRFLQAWGGIDAGLLGLRDHEKRDIEDRYGLRHLVTHLASAGKANDVHHLLRLEWIGERTGDSQIDAQRNNFYINTWYTAKDAVGYIDGYLADVTQAWELVDKQIEKTQNYEFIGMQCRYALITASVNSLSQNIPLELVLGLIKNNIWSKEQGLPYLHKLTAGGYSLLLKYLIDNFPDHNWGEFIKGNIETAYSILLPADKADALSGLASVLSWDQRNEALEILPLAVRPISRFTGDRSYDCSSQVELLQSLIPYLDEGQLNKALKAIRSIRNSRDRSVALLNLAPHLQADQLQESLQLAWDIQNEYEKSILLTELTTHLRGDIKDKTLQDILIVIQGIKNSADRVVTLSNFVFHITGTLKDEVTQELIKIAQGMKNYESGYERALVTLAPHLSSDQIPWMLERIKSTNDNYHRAKMLTEVVKYIPENFTETVIQEILKTARGINNDSTRIWALINLAPHLGPIQRKNIIQEAIDIVKRISDTDNRNAAIAGLVRYLSPAQLIQALEITRGLGDNYYRAETLVALAQPLYPDQMIMILKNVRDANPGLGRIWMYADLVPHFSGKMIVDIVEEAIEDIRGIKAEWSRALALTKLAKYLSPSQLQDALTLIREFKEGQPRSKALAALSIYLNSSQEQEVRELAQPLNAHEQAVALATITKSPEEKAMLIEKALDDLFRLRGWERSERTVKIAELIQHLSLPQLQKALQVAQFCPFLSDRVWLLTKIAPYLPDEIKEKTLLEALKLIESYESSESESLKERSLEDLAPILPVELLQKAISIAITIESDTIRDRVYSKIASYLPSSLKNEALNKIPTRTTQHLSQEQFQEVIKGTQSYSHNTIGILLLLSRSVRDFTDSQIQELLSSALGIPFYGARSIILANLIPFLNHEQLDRLLKDATGANVDSSNRAWLLGNIAPYLSPTQLSLAVKIAATISNKQGEQTLVVGRLLPHLAPIQIQEIFGLTGIRRYDASAKELFHLMSLEIKNRRIADHGFDLTELPRSNSYQIWRKDMKTLSNQERSRLLFNLCVINKYIAQTGRERAMYETAQAIIDVGHWWP